MNIPIRLALVALVLSLMLAIYGIIRFADAERARDLQSLQIQLNLAAEGRAEAIGRWIEGQYAALEGLARDQSLLTQLRRLREAPDKQIEQGLNDLLEDAARAIEGAGDWLSDPPPTLGRRPVGDWFILDPEDRPIAAVNGTSVLTPELIAWLGGTPLSERGMLDLHLGAAGRLLLGWLVPIRDPENAEEVIGRLLALHPLDAGLFDLLKTPGLTARTAESYLIRRRGHLIEYLSPLLDGSEPLSKRLAINTEGLIDAAALERPGQFHQGYNYALRESYAISRPIPATDWVLVQRIGAAEALAASDAWRMTLISGLTLIAVLIGSALVLVWFYASSRKVEALAESYRQAAERFERLSGFLDILADSQPHPILVVDASGHLTYANRRLAELTGLAVDEIRGRSLTAVFGQETGAHLSLAAQRVRETQSPQVETAALRDPEGQERVWRVHYQPFITSIVGSSPGVLITIEDLTELMRERARRERNTQRLIDTLVALVDERDPDAAHQSRYVVEVARAIADELGFDAIQRTTVEQAARLVNLGKIRIPRAILMKEKQLTEQELSRVREALDSGPQILCGIEFDGPVIETLEQVNEWADGSGRPKGLKGEQILPSAQVVALANDFVALISPRAFREAKGLDEAVSLLMQEIGRRFERRYVLALLNQLDNRGGRERWAEISQRRAIEVG
ncbi:PAS domain S-box protein [Caldichromatium japonicum]|uniref:PAS domain S-box protein n=1 Tax=Caldichromatium japonicum TaxID=2699430 RepID=A0A6G7VEI1_9GAMM|nr:HD domain-containing phosphohydrolase [Caldichromatium japonicum]QIK38449.1 PAS domain S-box protein [Caldichromatium japonicum]